MAGDAAIRRREMTSSTIDGYHAMYFDDVASAVDYCQTLVPYIVPRAPLRPHERAVVWFHVPPRSTGSTRGGCYLFASPGAIAAAQQAGLDTPLCGHVARASLPPAAVLLFGEDAPPPTPRSRNGRNSSPPTANSYSRIPSRWVDVGA